MPDDEVNRITHLNAMDWYSYDPFAVLDRKDCTVGALRAAAEDHDVSEKPLSTGRYEAGGNISLKDFAAKASGR